VANVDDFIQHEAHVRLKNNLEASGYQVQPLEFGGNFNYNASYR